MQSLNDQLNVSIGILYWAAQYSCWSEQVWLSGCGGSAAAAAPDDGVSAVLKAARAAFSGDGQVILRNVSLQLEALAPDGVEVQTNALPKADPDSPGLVRADLTFGPGGVLLAVSAPGVAPSTAPQPVEVDCAGRMIWPCLVDAHTHMIKTNTMPRCSCSDCTMSGALQCELCDRPRWTRDDMATRLNFSLRCAFAHGTAAMRCHLDGVQPDNPELTADTYAVFDEARAKWRGKVAFQGVANLFLPLWANPSIADKHVAEAVKHDGVVLGAYCGMNMKDADVSTWFDALFAYARKVRTTKLHIGHLP
jgi:cytosine deaminase